LNTAIGWDAMKNAHGDNNVAIGSSSLKELNSGSGNIAIGRCLVCEPQRFQQYNGRN